MPTTKLLPRAKYCDAGTSGRHGLNEELGRHTRQNYTKCGAKCESVTHLL